MEFSMLSHGGSYSMSPCGLSLLPTLYPGSTRFASIHATEHPKLRTSVVSRICLGPESHRS